MNIDMTVELQTVLVERLKNVLSDTISENLLLAIICERLTTELAQVKDEHTNLASRNRTLMDDVRELRAALHVSRDLDKD